MSIQYLPYERHALKGDPLVLHVGKYRIEYLAFCREGKEEQTPAIVVGGAFQNFTSYKPTVEAFLEDRPCIMIDLPSLGNNEQLAPELSGEGMAELLEGFFEQLEIKQAYLAGLSLGSIVSITFAANNPHLIKRLIIAGVIPEPRESWMLGMQESMRAFQSGAYFELAQAIVLSLMNYARLDKTKMSPTAQRMFIMQLANPNTNQAQRFEENARRLIEARGKLKYPECEVLVTTGEYDSFTLPFENAEFAARCPNATMILVENADHLVQLQRRKTAVALFKAWVNEEPVDNIPGTRLVPRDQLLSIERRTMPRHIPHYKNAVIDTQSTVETARKVIADKGINFSADVEIVDVSFFGALLKLKEPLDSIEEYQFDLTLHMSQPGVSLDLLIFEYQPEAGLMRCYFRHSNVPVAQLWAEQLKDQSLFTEKEASQRKSAQQIESA